MAGVNKSASGREEAAVAVGVALGKAGRALIVQTRTQRFPARPSMGGGDDRVGSRGRGLRAETGVGSGSWISFPWQLSVLFCCVPNMSVGPGISH